MCDRPKSDEGGVTPAHEEDSSTSSPQPTTISETKLEISSPAPLDTKHRKRRKSESRPAPSGTPSHRRVRSVSLSPFANQARRPDASHDEPLRQLSIHVLDVDQGESTLIVEWDLRAVEGRDPSRMPAFTVLIDGGYGDCGDAVVVPSLKVLGINEIDIMICTHFDGDHARGLTRVLGKEDTRIGLFVSRDIGEIVKTKDGMRSINHHDWAGSTMRSLINAANRSSKNLEVAKSCKMYKTGRKSDLLNLTVLHTLDGPLMDENIGSIAVLAEFGEFRYFSGGDLPSAYEDELFKGDKDSIHAFKCGHHGSANSTSKEFLEKTRPKAALISCGHQGFGHPTIDVVERLISAPSVKGIFLTNCIHNRYKINKDFINCTSTIINKAASSLRSRIDALSDSGKIDIDHKKFLLDSFMSPKVKCDDYIARLNKEQERVARRFRRAIIKEREHLDYSCSISAGKADSMHASVIGSNSRLGTISLFSECAKNRKVHGFTIFDENNSPVHFGISGKYEPGNTTINKWLKDSFTLRHGDSTAIGSSSEGGLCITPNPMF